VPYIRAVTLKMPSSMLHSVESGRVSREKKKGVARAKLYLLSFSHVQERRRSFAFLALACVSFIITFGHVFGFLLFTKKLP